MNAKRKVFLPATAIVVVLASAVCARAASINVGAANGAPGSTVTFQVKLTTAGDTVAGLMNDIAFDPATPIVSCQVNPAFATLSNTRLQPMGCTPEGNCTGVRAVILVLGGAIPNGVVLYSCTVHIAANAAVGTYPLTCSNQSASTPTGGEVSTQCTNGAITVGVPSTGGGGGGCAVADTTHAGIAEIAWMLLFPLALLLWSRWDPRGIGITAPD